MLEMLIQRLADATGEDVPDFRDGHARWRLYQLTAERMDASELLKKAAEIESDLSIASAIVVMMLERVDPSERQQWVEVLDPSVRSFAERRTRELEILESIDSAAVGSDLSVDDWSDWLQRKVAQSTRDALVLSILADSGRTKRIRRLASEALARETP